MASTTQRKAFISCKLTFLKDQRDHFTSAFGLYIKRIIEAGESWTEGGDNKMEYVELCQTIETVTMMLIDKCEEISGASERVVGSQIPWPSCELSDRTLQSPKETVSTSASESGQSAGDTQLKPILARIAVIEEALCSFRGTAEKSAEQQNGFDQQLKKLFSQHTKSDRNNNSIFRQVKEQIKTISSAQDALDQEREGRLQSLEKQLQKLCATQDIMKVEMASQMELAVHIPDGLESVRDNLDVIEASICQITDDCSSKHHYIETVTSDLEDKVMATTERVQVISANQDQKTTLLRELETRLQTLEEDSERNVKDVRKQVEKGESNFRILCQMLKDRLTPLEQLRTCLNQRASTRDENVKTLPKLIQDVASMYPRLQQLERTSSRTRCGFTALTEFAGYAGDTIRPYSTQYCNVGGNFNADSGIFTAPVDGLYVTSISLNVYCNENLLVGVKYQKQSDQHSDTLVCSSSASVQTTTACSVGVVDMKAGDILFSYMRDNVRPYLRFNSATVGVSCFLLA